MSNAPSMKMTVDEFFVWAEGRSGRYELVDGQVLAMAPERARHAMAKGAAYSAMLTAVRSAGLSCEAYPDGMTVRVNPFTAYEPDALVRCGEPLDGDAVEVFDAVIVVEVLSPSTRSHDTKTKLAGYFTVPSIQHYLIVDPDNRVVVHHRRDGDAIATRILTSGPLRFDPPGLDVAVEDLFEAR